MISNSNHKRKHESRKILWHVGGFIVLLIFAFLVISDIKIYHKKQQLKVQITNLQKQIKDVQSSNSNLKQGIESADDSQYIEKVAREQLDLQKPGEQAVSFIVPPAPSKGTSETGKISWWQHIVNFFKSE